MVLRFISLIAFLLLLVTSGCYLNPVLFSKGFKSADRQTSITVKNTADECTITIEGPIVNDTPSVFQNAIDEVNFRKCTNTWVILGSPGGYISPALEIGLIIKKNGYNTQIHHGLTCSSACALIFVSGNVKAISSSTAPTRLGLHQISFERGSEKICDSDPNSITNKRINDYLKFVLPNRAAEIFFNQMISTPCHKMTYMTSEQVISYGIASQTMRNCISCTLMK